MGLGLWGWIPSDGCEGKQKLVVELGSYHHDVVALVGHERESVEVHVAVEGIVGYYG